MCVCVCVCVCVRVCVHVYIHGNRTRSSRDIYIYVYIYSIYIIYTSSVSVYIYMCVCVCIYIYTCIHTYIYGNRGRSWRYFLFKVRGLLLYCVCVCVCVCACVCVCTFCIWNTKIVCVRKRVFSNFCRKSVCVYFAHAHTAHDNDTVVGLFWHCNRSLLTHARTAHDKTFGLSFRCCLCFFLFDCSRTHCTDKLVAFHSVAGACILLVIWRRRRISIWRQTCGLSLRCCFICACVRWCKSYEEEDTCMSYEEVETFRCCVICACLRLCVQGKPSTNKEHLLLIRNTYYQ